MLCLIKLLGTSDAWLFANMFSLVNLHVKQDLEKYILYIFFRIDLTN